MVKCLNTLKGHERKALQLRFGFEGKPRTLEELGKNFGVAVESIRQVELRTLSKLRSIMMDISYADIVWPGLLRVPFLMYVYKRCPGTERVNVQ